MNVDAKIKDARQDTKVANAAAHWGPRFTVNGVDFSDFKDVTSALHKLGRLVPARGSAQSWRAMRLATALRWRRNAMRQRARSSASRFCR